MLGKRLAQVFSLSTSAPPIQQRIFVIVGLGGMGKSEICLKFAEDHRDEFVLSGNFSNSPLTSQVLGCFLA